MPKTHCTCHNLEFSQFHDACMAGSSTVKACFLSLGCVPKCNQCIPQVRQIVSEVIAKPIPVRVAQTITAEA